MSDLLTVDDICQDLGITRNTWDKWRQRKVGPVCIELPNKTLRVRRAEYDEWLLSREEEAA